MAGIGNTAIPIHLYSGAAVAQGAEVENVASWRAERDGIIKGFNARSDAINAATDANVMLTKVVGNQISGTETDCLAAPVEIAGVAQANLGLEMPGTITTTTANLRFNAGDFLRVDVTVADGVSVTGVHGIVWVELV